MTKIASMVLRLSGMAIFHQLSGLGWGVFVLLSFLPFVGVAWLGWSAGLVMAAFFVDRIVFLIFKAAWQWRLMKGDTGSNKVRMVVITGVAGYMLLQMLGLVATFTDIARAPDLGRQLLELLIPTVLLYGFFFFRAVMAGTNTGDDGKYLPELVTFVLVNAGVFLVAFVGGIFLVRPLDGTFLGSMFQSGYGVVVFLVVFLRLLVDSLFFSRKTPKH